MQPPFTQYGPLEIRRDERGLVFEPVDAAELSRQCNCHVVLTEPGGLRGNHWHRRATEVSIVLGPARVRIRHQAGLEDVLVPEGQAYRFVFPPGVAHAMQNTGARPMLVVAFTDQVFDRATPDIVPDGLIEADP